MIWKNSKVLVTGAGGFIGSHLVSSLLAEGAEVRAMVRYNSSSSRGQVADIGETPRDKLTIAAGDVRDARFVREAVDGCDVVFHLAALIGIPYSYAAPASYVETNITGTLNVLEAVREAGTPRTVATSTSEVYGTARYIPIDEEHPLQGQSPYSASKIGADKLVESYNLSFDVPVVTVRPFNTYGPRQSPRAILPSLILQALSAESIRVGSLTPVRDLTYVSDTVAGFLAAATAKGVEGETINLGTGVAYSIADLVERVCEVAGRKPPVVVDEERIRPDSSEVMRLVAGNDKAREKLGWTAKVSLDEGLKLMVPWFREHPNYYDASVYNI